MATATDMSGRVVVITGANSGIGRATASDLAGRGATVVLACRSEAKTRPVIDDLVRETGNEAIEFLALDLADLASVRTAAASLLATDRRIDVLVNNAGVAGQRGVTADGFELAFGTNHVGHFLFTTLLLDRLVESAPARIVNVSSGNHFHATGIGWDAVRKPTRTFVGLHEYNVSKLANVLFTQQLADRLDPAVVSAFSTNPGPVDTDVWRRLPGPVYALFKRVRRLKTSAEGAAPSIHCATAPGLEAHSGGYFDEDCSRTDPNPAATPALGQELWRRTEAWVA